MSQPQKHTAAPRNAGWSRPWWLLPLLATALWTLWARPLLPIDETRYLGVAWEMWQRGDLLVPVMNGQPYSHKPPLLFWLIHAGWALFGVNEWWPRLVGPLGAAAAAALTVRFARLLWPASAAPTDQAGWLLAGSLGWLVYGCALMFDALLSACVLLALIGTWQAAQQQQLRNWLPVAVGIGLGLLAKGPVVLVHCLPAALLAPAWSENARQSPARWYGRLLLALVGGLLLAGAWAIPAALAGGPEYARAILWGQTAGRVVDSFAHDRPWWFIAALLPAMALPWTVTPAAWRSVVAGGGPARCFLLLWIGGTVLILSMVSGKQAHYLLPVLPAISLLAAAPHGGQSGSRQVAVTASVTFVVVLGLATTYFNANAARYNLRAPAQRVAALANAGVPVATLTDYDDQLHFLGRLRAPLPQIPRETLGAWVHAHPDAVLVLFADSPPPEAELRWIARYPYRDGSIGLWKPRSAVAQPMAGSGDMPR